MDDSERTTHASFRLKRTLCEIERLGLSLLINQSITGYNVLACSHSDMFHTIHHCFS